MGSGGDGVTFMYKGTDRWVDLRSLMLAIKFKVTKKDGSNLPDEPKVTPIQAIHSTMWKYAEIKFNQEFVMWGNEGYTLLYDEKSSLLAEIGYGTEAQRKNSK